MSTTYALQLTQSTSFFRVRAQNSDFPGNPSVRPLQNFYRTRGIWTDPVVAGGQPWQFLHWFRGIRTESRCRPNQGEERKWEERCRIVKGEESQPGQLSIQNEKKTRSLSVSPVFLISVVTSHTSHSVRLLRTLHGQEDWYRIAHWI